MIINMIFVIKMKTIYWSYENDLLGTHLHDIWDITMPQEIVWFNRLNPDIADSISISGKVCHSYNRQSTSSTAPSHTRHQH